MKFIRDYNIQIQTPEGDILTITKPFSIQFDITRNTLASTNKCNLTIYNLGPNTRNRIFKDRYSITNYWQLVIMAGYKKLEIVFQGNIYQSMSSKVGTDWITQIEAFDGLFGVQNGFISETVNAETSKGDTFNRIINTMPNMIAGSFGSQADEQSGSRGQILLGQSSSVLAEETNGNYFIDNETINILDPDEFLTGQVLLLDSDQIFSTPNRHDTFLDVPILFLPEARVGLLCEVRSIAEIYNGQYKTMGFKHNVSIRGDMGGEAKTVINLYAGAAGLREVS